MLNINHVKHTWWLMIDSLFLLLEMRYLNKLKIKFEIIMNKRMLDTHQDRYVL